MNLVCLFSYLFIYFFAFYAEIQNGHQKWRENDFWEKSPVGSADNMQVKNFVEFTLSCSISEINRYLRFTQKFKMATKSGGKTVFAKKRQYTLQIPRGSKISLKYLYLAPFPKEKHVFAFNAEIQDGCQKWLENNFCKKPPVALQIPCGSKI